MNKMSVDIVVAAAAAGENEDEIDNDNGAWSQWQDWALVDNLQSYILPIHNRQRPLSSSSSSSNHSHSKDRMAARWRALVRDVPELNGFDVEYVRSRYERLLEKYDVNVNDDDAVGDAGSTTEPSTKMPTMVLPELLPLLDGYSFEKNDQMTGFAFNIPGVADGTTLTTPPLKSISAAVSKGWVESEDSSVVYELGVPFEAFNLSGGGKSYSLDYAKQASGSIVSGLVDDKALASLGAVTGMLLASAAAFNTISHHMSVHVYWV